MATGYYKTDANGNPQWVSGPIASQELTTSTTITKAYANTEILIGTDALVMTLDAASSFEEGDTLTFRNIGADGNNIITISPDSSNGIAGSFPASAGGNADATTADGLVSKASVALNKDWVNTKATANKGDFSKLQIVDGGWLLVDGVGIWASEA